MIHKLLCLIGLHDWEPLDYWGIRYEDRICLRCERRDDQITRAKRRYRRLEARDRSRHNLACKLRDQQENVKT